MNRRLRLKEKVTAERSEPELAPVENGNKEKELEKKLGIDQKERSEERKSGIDLKPGGEGR